MKEAWKKLRETYCCAWCRGVFVCYIIWIAALGFDKWPGGVAATVILIGFSIMASRKHKKDRQERLKGLHGE